MRLGLLIVGLLLVVGCGRSPEDAMVDMADKLEEFAEVVEKCDTAEGLKANEGKLKELGTEISELGEEMEGMDEPSPEEALEMMKHIGRIATAQIKIQAAKAKIEDEAARNVIDEALKAGR